MKILTWETAVKEGYNQALKDIEKIVKEIASGQYVSADSLKYLIDKLKK